MIDPDSPAKPDGSTAPGTSSPGEDRADLAPGDPAEEAKRALRGSLRHPFRMGFVLGALLALATALLVIQNGEAVRINWLWLEFSAPLWLVLLLPLSAGAVVWETAKATIRRGRRVRRQRQEALGRLSGRPTTPKTGT